jgi:hypothetical protein
MFVNNPKSSFLYTKSSTFKVSTTKPSLHVYLSIIASMMMNSAESANSISPQAFTVQKPPEVHPPHAVTADYCYSLLTAADSQITTSQENIAKGAFWIKNQMKDYERLQNKG